MWQVMAARMRRLLGGSFSIVLGRCLRLFSTMRSARAHRGVLERASGRMRDGQPFFVGPGGLVDVRVNRWFCSDELRGLSRSTWRKYAYSLLVWLNFLSVYGVGWDEADAEAQEALKVWRVSDDRNPGAVAPGTFHHDLSVTWNLAAAETISLRYDHGLRRCVGQGSADGEVAGARPARAGRRLAAGVGRSWSCAPDDGRLRARAGRIP